MLKHGDVPITTEQRNKLLEEKRRQIVEIIARNSIDPRTNAPNPPLRIENAMREGRVTIDPFKGATEQIDEVVKKIHMIMPIKFTTVKMEVTIPAGVRQQVVRRAPSVSIGGQRLAGGGDLVQGQLLTN